MLKFITKLLRSIADELDTGTSSITSLDAIKVISILELLLNGDTQFSKVEACTYLGISRSTFDNLVLSGLLPKGKPMHEGIKSLFWYKSDLEIYELTHVKK